MTLRSRMLAQVSAGLACTLGFAWAQDDGLKHDPFARPAFPKTPSAVQSRESIGTGRGALPQPAWRPELDAVVVAGAKSMVSVAGTIVHIGEEINGHRLVEVHDQGAVFVRNRERVTLFLRGQQPAPGTAAAKPGGPSAPGRVGTPRMQDGAAERRDERKREDR